MAGEAFAWAAGRWQRLRDSTLPRRHRQVVVHDAVTVVDPTVGAGGSGVVGLAAGVLGPLGVLLVLWQPGLGGRV
jgi:hypothetical protein